METFLSLCQQPSLSLSQNTEKVLCTWMLLFPRTSLKTYSFSLICIKALIPTLKRLYERFCSLVSLEPPMNPKLLSILGLVFILIRDCFPIAEVNCLGLVLIFLPVNSHIVIVAVVILFIYVDVKA